jgi:hypothetical protein
MAAAFRVAKNGRLAPPRPLRAPMLAERQGAPGGLGECSRGGGGEGAVAARPQTAIVRPSPLRPPLHRRLGECGGGGAWPHRPGLRTGPINSESRPSHSDFRRTTPALGSPPRRHPPVRSAATLAAAPAPRRWGKGQGSSGPRRGRWAGACPRAAGRRRCGAGSRPMSASQPARLGPAAYCSWPPCPTSPPMVHPVWTGVGWKARMDIHSRSGV